MVVNTAKQAKSSSFKQDSEAGLTENGEQILMRSKLKGSLEKNIPDRGEKNMGKILEIYNVMPFFSLHVACSITDHQNSHAQHSTVQSYG